jgi:hypothetical protein
MGHRDYEGKALEAVRCEIIFADGTYIVAHKEIDLKDQRNRDVVQTPENLAKDETKALGRALRDAGIPQRLSELKLVMQWFPNVSRETSVNTSSPGRPPQNGTVAVGVQETLDEVFPGSTEETDDADAGADEPTPAQVLAKRFAFLEGPDKARIVQYARETLGCSNVLKAGEHAEALLAYLDGQPTAAPPTEEMPPGVTQEMRDEAVKTDAKNERRRYENPPEPDEEPF